MDSCKELRSHQSLALAYGVSYAPLHYVRADRIKEIDYLLL